MNCLSGIDFSGFGAVEKPPKPKKETPTVAPPLPSPVTPKSQSTFPTWLPYAVGIVGTGVIVILLVTTKGSK